MYFQNSVKMDHPEVMIRPSATSSSVVDKISELYGLDVVKFKQLEGYDDLNFYVECKSSELPASSKKYVCKILNNIDSKDTDVVDAQHEIMTRLGERGICASLPLLNKNQRYFSLEIFDNVKHVFRLLTYLEGAKLNDSLPTPELYHNVGDLVGRLYNELKDLKLEALNSRKSLWKLESVPQINQFLSAVPDVERQKLVKGVVKQFEDFVIPVIPDLESGVTHGDVNEHNILVNGSEIVGLIDFGDVCTAPFLFEIAICVTYMIIHAKDVSVGQDVLRGYQKHRRLTTSEIRLLKICVCARMCQSLVLGCYSAIRSPGNEYILSSQKNGWPLLSKLSQISDLQLLVLWGLEQD